jgi:tRNA(fMet)-specific endonuclease VapC
MLDTNIVIYTMKSKPTSVREAFSQNDGRMCISSITLMELVYGAERSSNPDHNLRAVEGFAARLEVLPLDSAAAYHAGQIRADLACAGLTIGPFDQLIAGHARSLGLVLVTNNMSEFARVKGLRLENWVA